MNNFSPKNSVYQLPHSFAPPADGLDSPTERYLPPADGLDSPTERYLPPADGLDAPTEQYAPPAEGAPSPIEQNVHLPPTKECTAPARAYSSEASPAFHYNIPPALNPDETTYYAPRNPTPPPLPPTYAPQTAHSTTHIPSPPVLAPHAPIPPKKNQGILLAAIIALVILVLCTIAGAIWIWHIATHDKETDQHTSTAHNSISKNHKNPSNNTKEQETHKNHDWKDSSDSLPQDTDDTLSSPPSASPTTQTPAPTTGINGDYSGWVSQNSRVGTASDMTYKMEITFTADTATISYPSLGCSGSLMLTNSSGNTLTYVEEITAGTCENHGYWVFTPNSSGGYNGTYESPSNQYTSSASISAQ